MKQRQNVELQFCFFRLVDKKIDNDYTLLINLILSCKLLNNLNQLHLKSNLMNVYKTVMF